MKSRKTQAIPARLEAGRRRFEQWRGTRSGRARIPERLWALAVRLAGAYGLCKTARTLGLDYNALKKRVEAAGSSDASAGPMPGTNTARRKMVTAKTVRTNTAGKETAITFVELPPLEPSSAPECIVELEHPRGTKMRIRLSGCQSPEVVTAVSRVFFGAGS